VLQTDTFKADVGCYNMLMDAYGRTRQWLEAENTFASMKRRQCVPTETSFNILMAAYSRGGQLERAEQLFNEMQEHNYFPGKADLLLNFANETGRLCFFGRRTIAFLAVNFVRGETKSVCTFFSLDSNALCFSRALHKQCIQSAVLLQLSLTTMGSSSFKASCL